MKINENYKIEAIDERNVCIMERKVPKAELGKEPKKPYWKTEGYYPNIEFALKSLVTKEINGTGIKGLKTVTDKIKELHELIEGLNYKTAMELLEYKKKNKELEATINEMSERIIDLEACE
ncbi:hypothetical protein [Clostridium pasteurianum]|uniref:Uncharacterized protein n=1 Tax=Clostridium pasteurianum BC1 TaxID=86416 RepID=R4K916_CLOPA|nr:hypothetical protein [Clostridium pasteurianum]AGK99033.1 hypothetical protein Clopa_4314 [Clostridium pasteurianum BC1]